jgi:hypothetical protein
LGFISKNNNFSITIKRPLWTSGGALEVHEK